MSNEKRVADVIQVFAPAGKQLARQHVIGIDEEHVHASEPVERADSIAPSRREVMRLKMRDLQTVPLDIRFKQRVLTADRLGNFVHNIDVFSFVDDQGVHDQRD